VYDALYKSTLNTVQGCNVQTNKRTGQRVHWWESGHAIRASLHDGQLPIPSNRVYRPYIAAAEAAWILSGTKSIQWIGKHTKIWNKFGTNGQIESAYGFRAREKWGDQIQRVIAALRKDESTRQAVLNLWDPQTDGMKFHPAPCPTQIVYNSNETHVHCQVFMRSSDLFVGLPYDVMTWSFVLDAIAASVGKKPGFVTFFLAHPHLYCSHAHMIHNEVEPHNYHLKLPGWSVRDIRTNPDAFVAISKKRLIKDEPHHPYEPRPEVFE